MNSKLATTLVATAVALGSASSFAFTAGVQDGFARNAAAPSAIVTTPTGDLVAQPGFLAQAQQSRADVSRDVAQSRTPLAAVAANPNGPVVVSQPAFQSEQSRAQVRQETAQARPALSAIAMNPQGDDVVVPGVMVHNDVRASLANGRADRS